MKFATLTALLWITAMATIAEEEEKSPILFHENPYTSIAVESVETTPPEREERWSDFLPLLGEEAKARGYSLPLPFGVSINHARIGEPVTIDSLSLRSIDGGAIDIPSALVDLDITDVQNTNLRLDAWILPFLNAYVLAGKSRGDTDVSIILPPVQVPSDCNRFCLIDFPGLSQTLSVDFDGETYGAGITIAGGIGEFFGVLDANYTETGLDILKGRARAVVVSGRLGWNGQLGDFTGQLWLGGISQDIEQTAVVPLSILGLPAYEVSVDVDSDAGITPTVGARWDISREWSIISEYSWGDRDFFLASLGYRF